MAIESFFSLGNRNLAGAKKKDFWESLNRIPEHHPKMPHKINDFPGKPGFSQKFVDFTIFFLKIFFSQSTIEICRRQKKRFAIEIPENLFFFSDNRNF